MAFFKEASHPRLKPAKAILWIVKNAQKEVLGQKLKSMVIEPKYLENIGLGGLSKKKG